MIKLFSRKIELIEILYKFKLKVTLAAVNECKMFPDKLIPYMQAINLPDTQRVCLSNDITGGPLEATSDPLLAATRGPLVLLLVACQRATSSLHVGYYY